MKIVLHEKANWKTTPRSRGIIYVCDDDGKGFGDDGVTALGRIVGGGDSPHEFRPDEVCPDLSSERMKGIAAELDLLDKETKEYLRDKVTL